LNESENVVRLAGKVAIVFGAGPNVGGTIAHFLAREGARVAANDLNPQVAEETAEFIRSRGFEAIGIGGDATTEATIERIIKETVARYGRLDTIVNMAGDVYWSPIVDMDLEKWNTALLSYPTAGMLTTKHAARAMIAGGTRGSIIHLLSTAAHFGEASGACYTAAKAAMLNLARSAAMDLAHDGIRVNTVTPCGMEHQMWTRMRAEGLDAGYKAPVRRSFYSRDDYLKMIPLERFPRASDLAHACVFLASDEAEFITGIDIPVDGGLRHKYPAWRPGDFTGVNIEDYKRDLMVTEYGEAVRTLAEEAQRQNSVKR
jgi:NAD(P)-dependent dehydrogenase (short-subunit alcohol dehydrogenase family)